METNAPRRAGGSLDRGCPACGVAMEPRWFDRKPAGKLQLDICFGCRGVWFDPMESPQLAPGAVLELFRIVQKAGEGPAHPLPDLLHCLACSGRLVLTNDLQRTNRIAYYRCPNGHGRFTTFFQFLREKNFVRDLSLGEIERLKATVAQVRCSSCGAPVDLARDAACRFCRAPISILDAQAVGKTLAELDAAERKRLDPDPQGIIDGLLAGQATRRRLDRIESGGRSWEAATWKQRAEGGADIVDLVGDALDFFMGK